MSKKIKTSKTERDAAMMKRMADKNMKVVEPTPEVTVVPEVAAPQMTAEASTVTPVEPDTVKGDDSKVNMKAAKPKKSRLNAAVLKYRAQPEFKPEQIIKIIIPASAKPKRRIALERYELYEDGMSVAAYIEKAKKVMGIPTSLAKNDIRWDYSKGFIDVT
jgi:hypothetical protein